jgi:Bacterial antitoxin of ParD toxin-antitoxin type II system and RHH
MKIKKNTAIKLKSFLGTLKPKKNILDHNNYWKLIGEKGIVIDEIENESGRILILFDKNLDEFEVENHNPIKNSLWIKKTDLEIGADLRMLEEENKITLIKKAINDGIESGTAENFNSQEFLDSLKAKRRDT